MVVVEGKIKGKARPRFNTKTGRAFTPGDTISYENWIKCCYKEQDGKYLDGPIRARIEVYYQIPKSYTKGKRLACKHNITPPCKKPDIDNCIKVILDSLNGIAYKDDSQIVEVIAVKKWTEGIERLEFILEEVTYEN